MATKKIGSSSCKKDDKTATTTNKFAKIKWIFYTKFNNSNKSRKKSQMFSAKVNKKKKNKNNNNEKYKTMSCAILDASAAAVAH